MRGYGRVHFTVACDRCGAEVQFSFAWDRAVNHQAIEDTTHQTPAGEPCDLPVGQVELVLATGDPIGFRS